MTAPSTPGAVGGGKLSTAPVLNVIGIDPSLTATGIAHADGTLTTVKHRHADDQRLLELQSDITHAICHGSPALVIIEDLPTHAHGAGKTGMAQGVVRLTCYNHATPYVTVTAATLKKFATGKGNATKPDMRMALYRRTGRDVRDDNQVDAFWLRTLGLYLLGRPLITLPATHVDALAKISQTDRDRIAELTA